MAGGNGSPAATEMAERARAQEKEEEMSGGFLRAPQTRDNDLSPDEWGPSVRTAVSASPSQQRHVSLTSGAPRSEIVSICSEPVICANCKKSPLGW
jgi:hypothetical protein